MGQSSFLSSVSNINKALLLKSKEDRDYSGLRCEYDLLSFTTIRAYYRYFTGILRQYNYCVNVRNDRA